MNVFELADALRELPGATVREEEPLSRHLPYRIGGPTHLWVEVVDVATLKEALKRARAHKVPWRVHWPFEEWLVRDGGIAGLVIRPGHAFEDWRVEDGGLVLGGACLLASVALRADLFDRSLLGRWPGTPGAIFARKEQRLFTDLITRVRWLQGRSIEEARLAPGEDPPELSETAVLLDVVVPLGPRPPRRVRHPSPPPPGTLFADPLQDDKIVPSRRVLESAGVIGARLRGWRLTPAEPGTLVHIGGSTCSDALLFTQGTKARAEKSRGVELHSRIPLIGQDPPAPRQKVRP